MALPGTRDARLFYRAAFQRLDDAQFLKEAARTTAAVYLAGYSVECTIKALILSATPEAQHIDILAEFRGAQAHNYEWLLRFYRDRCGQTLPAQLAPDYVRVNTWTTDLRYSPGTLKDKDAQLFITSAIKIVEWADGRL